MEEGSNWETDDLLAGQDITSKYWGPSTQWPNILDLLRISMQK
jgi:hypothetical protein